MANDDPETFIEKMCRDIWLSLDTLGGRVFVESASEDNIDRCTIELNCQWSSDWLSELYVRIGTEDHPPTERTRRSRRIEKAENDAPEAGWSLADCWLTISVYEFSEAQIAESAAKNAGKPILGRFKYYERVNSSDGVVSDVRPGVSAWIGLGPKNFHLLREQMLAGEKPDFDLGLRVGFPQGSVITGWVDTKVQWDGEASLPISEARFAWNRSKWNNDTDDEIGLNDQPVDDEPVEYDPPREHVELLQSANKLEAAIARLTLPVWLAAGAAIFAAIAAR